MQRLEYSFRQNRSFCGIYQNVTDNRLIYPVFMTHVNHDLTLSHQEPTVLPSFVTNFSAAMYSLKFGWALRRRKSVSVNGISGSSCKQPRHQPQHLCQYYIINVTCTTHTPTPQRPLANVLEIMNVIPLALQKSMFCISSFLFPSHPQPTFMITPSPTHIPSYFFHFHPFASFCLKVMDRWTTLVTLQYDSENIYLGWTMQRSSCHLMLHCHCLSQSLLINCSQFKWALAIALLIRGEAGL